MKENAEFLYPDIDFYSVVSGNEIHVIDTDPYSLSRGVGIVMMMMMTVI